MCGLAEASVALSAVGAATSAYGSYQQGQAAKAAGNYQAAVMRNNQILADRAAEDALARGKEAEAEKRRQTKQVIGRQRAALAANGVLVDSGSALDITSDTAEFGELDALTIRSNAEREAMGFRAQGANFGAEAGLAQMRGNSAATAGTLGAFGTALAGAGSVGSKWYSFNQAGAFKTKTPQWQPMADWAG